MGLFSFLRPKPNDISQDWILEGFNSCLDGFIILQGEDFYVSPNLAVRMGYELGDERFKSKTWWHEQVHPTDLPRVLAYIEGRREGKTDVRQVEYRVRHRSGHWISLLVNTHVVGVPGEAKKWLLGTVSDISSYRVLHDQLERTIQDGEKTSQAKSTFIASLNHELRTPLNGILGMVSLLKDENLNKEQVLKLDNISASAQLLLNLVNDILDVSKITAGKLELEHRDFGLRALLQNTEGMLKSVATMKGISLILDVDSQVPNAVKGDQVRIQQILVNLLSNAIKFTQKGDVIFKVQVKEIIEDKEVVIFKIIDSGIGISPEVLPRLFQDFTQANQSVTRTHGGTGLGLSICKKLVSIMGGEIGVQSTEGKGSTFWFTVPLSRGHEAPRQVVESETAEEHQAEQIEGSLSEYRVLVVEDNTINQQVIVGLVSTLGHLPEVVSNGKDAVDLAKKKHFDIIFMDINMPIMDGFEATRLIKQSEEGRKVPIIACTADTVTTSKEEFVKRGFIDVVSKPINKNVLEDIILDYAGRDHVFEGVFPEVESPAPSAEENPLENGSVSEAQLVSGDQVKTQEPKEEPAPSAPEPQVQPAQLSEDQLASENTAPSGGEVTETNVSASAPSAPEPQVQPAQLSEAQLASENTAPSGGEVTETNVSASAPSAPEPQVQPAQLSEAQLASENKAPSGGEVTETNVSASAPPPAADIPQSKSGDSIIVNEGFIRTLANDIGKEIVLGLLDTYKQDARKIVEELTAQESVEESHKLAHTLAGMSDNLGLTGIGKTARSIMEATRNNGSKPDDLIQQLTLNFNSSVVGIDHIIETL